jgi:hypothetical protein
VFALDAVGDAGLGWLLAGVLLHVSGQVSRGLAWHGVLRAPWPGVKRRSACAWHVCGAGLTGVLSARGGDVVRIALARRGLAGSTWPALAGSLAAEGSFDTVCGLLLALVAAGLGIGALAAPSPAVVAAVAVAAPILLLAAARTARLRGLLREFRRGVAVLGAPRRWLRQVLPWQVCARVLRLGAVTCFLLAFRLPVTPAVVIAACAALGSGALLPIPGAGPAAIGATLLVAVPLAAAHPVDRGAVGALAIALPATLTLVGAALSTVLLCALVRARSPRALLRVVSAPAAVAGADG